MDREQLNVLFALMKAFPQERHNVDEDGVLRIEIQLTDEQLNFWRGAQRMLEPVEEGQA